MSMCKDCARMVQFKRHAPGHSGLEQNSDPVGEEPGSLRHTYFICRVCGTQWSHLSDRNDPRAGWSTLLPVTTERVLPRHFR